MKKQLSIVKIGGGVIENPQALRRFCELFAALKGPKVLVHGGGKSATALASKLGIKTKMVHGRRITDKESLEVTTMSYAGWANKTIVACLQSFGCNALGLSGADGNSISAVKRAVSEIDYGFVGDITVVNYSLIEKLLKAEICPVFCALTHDGKGQLLNTNADTIASALSAAMVAGYSCRLLYCFEKDGVLSDLEKNTVIPLLTEALLEEGVSNGSIHAGMIPKLENGFKALQAGVAEVIIGNENILKEKGHGTQLK